MCNDIERFYKLIEKLKGICCQCLEERSWEQITLRNIDGHNPYWEKCRKGIYIFFDLNETRSHGKNLRVVRVGTHGTKKGEGKSTLWNRLRQHKGTVRNGGGNHRSSIFRSLVGEALIRRDGNGPAAWGIGANAPQNIRALEGGHERNVSDYIRKLPFLIVKVDDRDGREYLEENLIALLSNIKRGAIIPPCPDEPSPDWLGRYSSRDKVRESGLWNNHHVNGRYDRNCLDKLKGYINSMEYVN